MAVLYLVVENKKDWSPFYPSEDVITFQEYLNLQQPSGIGRTRLINLCRSSRYLSDGYYCSLLAEARGHHVIPGIRALQDLRNRTLYGLQLEGLITAKQDTLWRQQSADGERVSIKTYFDTTKDEALSGFAKQLFERFACPILEVEIKKRKTWEIVSLKPLSPKDLDGEEETLFAEALDKYSRKVWQKPKARKHYRYDLAILMNPEETLAPSNRGALRKFADAGNALGISVDLIEKKDLLRIAEYDALFIRETTQLDHHTYRYAKKAEAENLVVIDDPTSILRCTNKVYLADLFKTHQVPAPHTLFLSRDNKAQLETAAQTLGFPIVLKIPDGAFSRGVIKVENAEELTTRTDELFKQTALLIAQEFMLTEFDWRIGVLNQKPIFACRYYMAKNHWQIYNHKSGKTDAGRFDTLPTYEVPPPVISAALKATRPIGDGLYGVDIKQNGNKVYVIEVNDNPNIDSGVEDKFLGDQLYTLIMEEFIRRIEQRRGVR